MDQAKQVESLSQEHNNKSHQSWWIVYSYLTAGILLLISVFLFLPNST